jgi:acyl-CoA thioesterase FadM
VTATATATATATVGSLSTDTTVLTTRPRYEGANICNWIGFKHINYLVEEAVLGHFREHGHSAGGLYERHGLGVDIVHLDTKIKHSFHIDDLVTATVRPVGVEEAQLRLLVELRVDRDGPVLAARARVGVSLRLDPRGLRTEPVPDDLAPIAVDRLGRPGVPVVPGDDPLSGLLAGHNGFGWVARMPYYYCHFTERVQMSGYLRQMETALDLFMADRGASIKRMLDEQNWIPIVPHSSITLLDEAVMEDDLYTVFVVENILKRLTFTARMDCYVLREGQLVQTATGRITHGWAAIEDRATVALVPFDDRLTRVLTGAPAGTGAGQSG